MVPIVERVGRPRQLESPDRVHPDALERQQHLGLQVEFEQYRSAFWARSAPPSRGPASTTVVECRRRRDHRATRPAVESVARIPRTGG